MAAKRVRNYQAEERRRNELARERGFTSRAQQRTAVRKQTIRLVRDPKAKGGYAVKRPTAKTPTAPRRGKTYRDKIDFLGYEMSKSAISQEWSDYAAKTEKARYEPDQAKSLGITRSAYTEAYFRAFLDPDNPYRSQRYNGGSDALYYWLVTLNGFMEADEYDSKYGEFK